MALPTPLPRSIYIDRFTSSRPDFVLVTPIAAKTRKQQTTAGGWVLRSGRGQLRKTGSTSAAPPATSTATNPRQHRPKDLNNLARHPPRRDQVLWGHQTSDQLNAARKTAQRPLLHLLQGASVSLHIILLGVGGTIYNTHTLKPFKELGLDSQRVKKLASKLHVHSVNFAAKLVHTRRALSSTDINSHQEPVSGQACKNPPDNHWFFFSFFAVDELYGSRYQSGSILWISLINVRGEWFSLPA